MLICCVLAVHAAHVLHVMSSAYGHAPPGMPVGGGRPWIDPAAATLAQGPGRARAWNRGRHTGTAATHEELRQKP